jgi:uncharacterized protein (DUF427 family)
MLTGQNPSPGLRNRPQHTISVAPYGKHVTVRSNGAVIASSDKALVLNEHTHQPVVYIPFADIDFGKLAATDTSTHCPFKGDASYWSVKDGAKDAMWAYQDPYDEMLEIKDHGAFYPNRVTIEAA